jgi:hypothetical protein
MARRFLLGSFLVSSTCFAGHFSIDQMPPGAEVTVPPTARTVVPMGARIKLTSTDSPQSVRISPVGNGSVFAAPIKLAIFDPHQDRVKYVVVSPNEPFLYSFKGLSSISIVPSLVRSSPEAVKGIKMEIESDKAVTLAR